jgi:malic enzyme
MAVVEEFCYAVKDKWPHALIQFEDFQTDRAFEILERLQDKVLCFNDDIQGTAAVVVAGLVNGLKGQHTELKDARFLFYGAGSSAVGVAQLLALLLEKYGKQTKEDAWKQIWMLDSKGVIYKERGDELPHHKKIVARDDIDQAPPSNDLDVVVGHIKPHALIGLTGRGPAFTEEVVKKMCETNKRPLIMALSNPTSQAEITAEHAIHWSKGTAIFTSGSPFDPVEYEGRTIEIGQANNVFIFPGMGFGAVMAKAKKVVAEMFLAAAVALADYVDKERIEAGTVYPILEDLREVSAVIASSVVKEALDLGLAQIERPKEAIMEYIKARMWEPEKVMHFDVESKL